MKTSRFPGPLLAAVFYLCGLCLALFPASAQSEEHTKDKKQAEIREAVKNTLSELYELQPGSKDVIRKAAGYAVFNSFGMKIFYAGGGLGHWHGCQQQNEG